MLIYALIASLVTLFMGFAASFMFPVKVDLASLGMDDSAQVERKLYYTEQELDKADREGEERLKQVKKRLSEKGSFYHSRRARLSGWWLTWITWLILPLTLPRRPRWSEGIALAIPCLGTLFGILLPYELSCIVVAFSSGELFKYFLFRDNLLRVHRSAK